MSITLREINRENWRTCYRLDAGDGGKYVASTQFSMLETLFDNRHDMRAIYADDDMIGFVMFGQDEDVPEDAYGIWRYLIDKSHHGKGYSKTALNLVINHIKTVEGINAIYVSIIPDNEAGKALYESVGFVMTGDMLGDEAVMRLDI